MTVDLADVGKSLVKHASKAEFSAQRGVIIELFPFICDAAKRMSSRAISRFLADKHAIKLSAVTINKALKESDRYWMLWVNEIMPSVQIIAFTMKIPVEDFLYSRETIVKLLMQHMQQAMDVKKTPNLELGTAFGVLNTKWVLLSEDNFNTACKYARVYFAKYCNAESKSKTAKGGK
jgi:hypothetical protein